MDKKDAYPLFDVWCRGYIFYGYQRGETFCKCVGAYARIFSLNADRSVGKGDVDQTQEMSDCH